jgi:hypothetical protein
MALMFLKTYQITRCHDTIDRNVYYNLKLPPNCLENVDLSVRIGRLRSSSLAASFQEGGT